MTITGKPGGASYAEILAKAREKVFLKELGIQDTKIRRAMNGVIVIQVPQGKQLASSRLTDALGEEARVLNPVAIRKLRMRGIDPSTTLEEIYTELMALSGCSHSDIKVSPINSMRNGRNLG